MALRFYLFKWLAKNNEAVLGRYLSSTSSVFFGRMLLLNTFGVAMIEKNRLMTLNEVLLETRMGKTKLYRLVKEGRFPPQRRSGDGSALWIRGEVDYWIDCLIQCVEYEYRKAA